MRAKLLTGSYLLAATLAAGCSPYVYAPEIESFSTSVTTIGSSYRSGRALATADFETERRRAWLARREPFQPDGACLIPDAAEPCRMAARDSRQQAREADRRRAFEGQLASIGRVETIVTALSAYASALEAVTTQADRKAFDEATGKLVESAGALAAAAGSVAGPGGVVPAAVAAPIVALAGLAIGQILDAERFYALERGVTRADPAIGIVGNAIGDALDRLAQDNRTRLSRRLAAGAQASPNSALGYAERLAQAEADAEALNALRGVKGRELGASLTKAHAELLAALRDPSRQLKPLQDAVQALSAAANAVSDAFKKASEG